LFSSLKPLSEKRDLIQSPIDCAVSQKEETGVNKKLDEQLCQSYPSLYRGRHNKTVPTLMGRGFECADGWYTLICVVSELLTKHNPEIYAVQVKEKFGGLRFYHDGCDDYTLGVQMTAETLSSYICEICGAPGFLNDNEGWWSTRCDAHASGHLDSENQDVDISGVAELGLGAAWSRLAAILKNSAAWHTEKNGMPEAEFQIAKENGHLIIQFTGGNLMTAGMVDLIAHYANRIDENTGLIVIGNK
jgi:hypothetical protein